MTLTNEPFQPVRLYYSIPDRDSVSGRLRTLGCLVEAPDEQCWQWLFQAEAASLRFGSGYAYRIRHRLAFCDCAAFLQTMLGGQINFSA